MSAKNQIQISPEQINIPRYTDRSLPDYRHLPFRNAHPFLDEDGHSYKEKLSPCDSFSVDNWQSCADYLFSIDLFNHSFWWEAHERLKYVSIGAGRESETGQFVQGLIQISAALLKHFLKEKEGAETLAELGLESLENAPKTYLGIDVVTLITQVENCFEIEGSNYPQIHLKHPELL